MAKKLTVSRIREQANRYNETTTITFIEESDEFEVLLFPYFSNDRISRMLESLKDDLDGFEAHGIKLDDQLTIPFILHHTILEFTDVGKLNKKRYKDDETYYKASAQYFHEFMKTHYFTEIANSLVDSEVQKIFDKVNEMLVASDKLERMMSKVKDEIQNLDLQSPELREKIQGIPQVQ